MNYRIITDSFGSVRGKEWLNGEGRQLHREDGPAVEWSSGRKEWWLNGRPHRKDGPAVVCPDGSRFWYLNGKRHRIDGPAVECSNGRKEWWLNGKHLSEEEFRIITIGNFPEELFEL